MANEFDDKVEQTVSIQELEDQKYAACMVFGGDEGKECTYKKGFMKRQAIFSCLTCTPEGNAGVCTACCLFCHADHKVVELWTKRNFRCDCGNSKFGEFYCKILADKDETNPGNLYNQNFKGFYCTCNTEDQADMIQCCICEDWFHEIHLDFESIDKVPGNGEDELSYEDFVCQACAKKCSFLTLYPSSIWKPAGQCDAPQNTGKEENVLGSSFMAENAVVPLDTPVVANATTDVAPELVSSGEVVVSQDESKTNMGARFSSSKFIPGMDPIVATATTDVSSSGQVLTIKDKSKRNIGPVFTKSKFFLGMGPIDASGSTDVALELESTGKVMPSEDKSKRNIGARFSKSPFFLGMAPTVASVTTDVTPELKSGGKPVFSKEKPETDIGLKDSSLKCILKVDPRTASLKNTTPMFLSKNWREILCKCVTCVAFYEEKSISFLIDPDDSIAEYEKMAAKKWEELRWKEEAQLDSLRELSGANPTKIMDGITDMKGELQFFLANTDTSKPVTAADLGEVFKQFAKRQRRL